MDYFLALEKVTAWQQTRRGVELTVDRETVRFDFITADIVRLKVSQAGVFDATPTFAVTQDEFGTPGFTVQKTSRHLVLTSATLSVKIGLAPFAYEITRLDGSTVVKSAAGGAYGYINNEWRVRRVKKKADTILGLGEKTLPYNHNGRKVTMWNTDILGPAGDGSIRVKDDPSSPFSPTSDRYDPYYISINLHYHLPASAPEQATASYIDCGYKLNYDFTDASTYEIHGEGGQLTEYIFGGPSLRGIVEQYTRLTGRMAAPPIWALGHHQCRWFDYSQDDVHALAASYRDKKLPCDALWLDIDYMDEYRVFTWNKDRFPDAEAMLKALKKDGFRVITIIDPGVKFDPGYAVFDEGYERNLFCKNENGQTYIGQVWPGRTAFPDFVKEEARRWWGRLNAEHVQAGLAGIWNDMNEPATGVISPFDMRFDHDGADHPHERYRNQYALLMAMGTVMGLREAMPDLRTFVLSRAGFAGIQRYAANWTGDNCATWAHLAMSIPMNANLGLSGQPFIGSDIGGFMGKTNPELFVRWYQYGVFQPFMRNHLCKGSLEHYPWSFGEEPEALVRQALELRYRLLPAIYTAFMQTAETGVPIHRSFALEWQSDPTAVATYTEYMFGDHLLVAPVTTEGATTRTLYLPPGDWRSFATGEHFKGGQSITVDAPLDTLPLFVRAGAIIAQMDVAQSTEGLAPKTIELHLYLPTTDGSTESLLHEDDGLTDAHLRGAYVRTAFTVRKKGKKITLSAKVSGGGFPEHKRKSFTLILHGGKGKPKTIKNRGEDFNIEL